MRTLSFMQMKDVPTAWRPRLRELSFGPEAGTMWRWTFQSGECWVALLQEADRIVAWACLTNEDDQLPVVGCYVDKGLRGKGLGSTVANHLLTMIDLQQATAVYAVSYNWPKWPKILQQFGLVHFEWE